jgi:hypothetical protein
VGYTDKHSRDVFRTLKRKNNTVIHSRDAIWLHKMQKDGVKDRVSATITMEDDVIEIPIKKGINKV